MAEAAVAKAALDEAALAEAALDVAEAAKMAAAVDARNSLPQQRQARRRRRWQL